MNKKSKSTITYDLINQILTEDKPSKGAKTNHSVLSFEMKTLVIDTLQAILKSTLLQGNASEKN